MSPYRHESSDSKVSTFSEKLKVSDDTNGASSATPGSSGQGANPCQKNLQTVPKQRLRRLSTLMRNSNMQKYRPRSDWTPKKLKRETEYDVSAVTPVSRIEDLEPEDVIIAVMGPTGTGKSTFIQRATKQQWGVGHGLESQTSEVSAVRVEFTDGIRLVLVDTPGFDDTRKSDLDILKVIAEWFKGVYEHQLEISGVLYLHRISDNRMAGTPRKNLELFRKLYGDKFYERVILTTTMWAETPEADDSEESVFRRRQDELEREYWADMIARGAHVRQFRGTQKSAWEGLDSIINAAKERQRERIALEIQEELVNLSKSVPTTKAGQHLHSIVGELVQRQTGLLDRIREELGKTSDPEVLRQLIAELHDLRRQRKQALKDMRQLDTSVVGRILQLVENIQRLVKAVLVRATSA